MSSAATKAKIAAVLKSQPRELINELPDTNVSVEEILWDDSLLDSYRHFVFNPSKEQLDNLKKYFCFLPQKRSFSAADVQIIAGFASMIPNMFGGGNDARNFYFEIGENQEQFVVSPEVLNVSLGPDDTIKATDDTYDCINPKNDKDKTTIRHNAKVFLDALTTDDITRARLGMISLSLMRLAARDAANVRNHVNGRLYTQWGQLCEMDCPTPGLFFPDEALQGLKIQINNNMDHFRRIVVMLIRQVEISPREAVSKETAMYEYFVRIPFSSNGLHMLRLLNSACTALGKEKIQVLDIAANTKSPVLIAQAKALENILAWIRFGIEGDGVTQDGTRVRTKFFAYSRFLDGRIFVSISPTKCRELSCFLIGLSGSLKSGPEKMYALANFAMKDQFMKQGLEIYTTIAQIDPKTIAATTRAAPTTSEQQALNFLEEMLHKKS